MTFNDLMIVLDKMGVDTSGISASRPNQILIPCILAGHTHKSGSDSHPSLSIRYGDPGKWTVFKCFACKNQGRLWQLVDMLGHFEDNEEIKQLANKLAVDDKPTLTSQIDSIHGMDDWFSESKGGMLTILNEEILDRWTPAWGSDRAREYLQLRKVSEEVCAEFDLRYDGRSDRVLCPVRQKSGSLVGAVGRLLKQGEPRYWNYLGFPAGNTLGGVHKVRPEDSTVVVVEGFFDMLRAWPTMQQLGASVVCTWRAEMTKIQAGILAGLDKNIQCWYDQDSAGEAGYKMAQQQLANTYGLRRATWGDRDLDVGEMPQEKIVSIFTSLKGDLL